MELLESNERLYLETAWEGRIIEKGRRIPWNRSLRLPIKIPQEIYRAQWHAMTCHENCPVIQNRQEMRYLMHAWIFAYRNIHTTGAHRIR